MERPSKRLRLLALHGFGASALIFQEQLRRAKLLQALEELADLVRHCASRLPVSVAGLNSLAAGFPGRLHHA